MKKELTNQQIAKILKLRKGFDVCDLEFNLYLYAQDLKKYSWALEAEAQSLTETMFGLDGRKGQGLRPEIRHYSGLTKLVNAKVKEIGLDWTVKESPNGEGMSMYTIA